MKHRLHTWRYWLWFATGWGALALAWHWGKSVLQDESVVTVIFAALIVISGFALVAFQRQRAEKVLAAKRLKLATEASGVGIWEFDLVSKRYYWDSAMFALFGLKPDQVGARNDDWIKLLSPTDLKRMRDATRATIRDGKVFDMTFTIRRPDGVIRDMRNRAALYADDHGVPRRLIGATEDVTERRRQLTELRVAAAAFESHESMVVTDAQMNILRVNKAFCELFGYSAHEAVGRTPRMLKSGRHDKEFYAIMWQELLSHHGWKGEIWDVRKNGEEFPCWLCISAVMDDEGMVSHYVATHTDITLRKAAEDDVKRLAFYDPLTNLPNRRLLADRLQQGLLTARRDGLQLGLLFVDLDKFKPVNDRFGHAAGDVLLQAVGVRLRACVRESDTVARVGGDEFVVLLPALGASEHALAVAEKVFAALRRPFSLPGGQQVSISSSIGVAVYPQHGQTEQELSQHADMAMYDAKAAGRDRIMFFTPDLPANPTH